MAREKTHKATRPIGIETGSGNELSIVSGGNRLRPGMKLIITALLPNGHMRASTPDRNHAVTLSSARGHYRVDSVLTIARVHN